MADRIPSGCKLGLAGDGNGASPGMIRYLIDRGLRDLHIVCAPIGGMQVDMLIGAGAVAAVETSAVSLGEAGGAPCFNRAVKSGSIRILDATCPAVFAGLTAAQKGVPFMPIRGILGSDILRNRMDWKVISNPFDENDKLVAVSAIQPDISLIHAAEADRFGNVRLGRRRELMLLAYASKQTFVTVERVSETSLLEDERMAAGVLPAMYVSAVTEFKNGAWPTGLYAEYPPDNAELARYAQLARTSEGLQEYLSGTRSAA
ncbi:CoA synthetase [Bradyrhizobium jicamae]|uniref:CoA synthetase n=2 Tax=Bradyrhizobium jicamae TaxID=280332 RepID=A0ABS5FT71_9BRAD|nr:CoA synthetase [Bradyrhizobium jicamae]